MISETLNKISAWIPEYHSIDQFVATQPFEHADDRSIYLIDKQLREWTEASLTLSLDEYRELYQSSRITSDAVTRSIQEYLTRHLFQEDQYNGNFSLLTQLIFDWMMTDLSDTASNDSKRPEWQLVAHQLKAHCYDDPMHLIISESLSAITQHYAQQLEHNDRYNNHEDFITDWCRVKSQSHSSWQALILSLPRDREEAILSLMNRLGIPAAQIETYCFQILWQLKGWVGYAKGFSRKWPETRVIQESEIILMWLIHEVYWMHHRVNTQVALSFDPQCGTHDGAHNGSWQQFICMRAEDLDPIYAQHLKNLVDRLVMSGHEAHWLWQRAYELVYENHLIENLDLGQKSLPYFTAESSVDWFFCMDVRSEPLRNAIEQLPGHSTHGVAGFFSSAFAFSDKTTCTKSTQCPVLVDPDVNLSGHTTKQTLLQQAGALFGDSVAKLKESWAAPFMLFEMLGMTSATKMAFRSIAPSRWQQLQSRWQANTFTSTPELDTQSLIDDMTLARAVECAKSLLSVLPAGRRLAPVVVICAHQAQTDNNPYHSTLQCGACGGNSGFINAVVAANILNDLSVRAELDRQSFFVPEQTIFVAACHNTTTDAVIWADRDEVTALDASLQSLVQQVDDITTKLACNRHMRIPDSPVPHERASNWAELLPELGLANNAAMIIAPRTLTKGINLEGRVFLHSYEPQRDADGAILEQILLGPALVAHWINLQYYLSSVSPKVFGSGNKAIHNVLPGIGVMEGNQSDLRYGLPAQSVVWNDQRLHEPQRLLLVIYADRHVVDRIMSRHCALHNILEGHWINLKIMTPSEFDSSTFNQKEVHHVSTCTH